MDSVELTGLLRWSDLLRYQQKTRIRPERGMGLKIHAQVVVMWLSASHPT
jgi:hypothetical protein